MGGKHEFAKPGIDHFQQGFVFANGDPTPSNERSGGGSRLPYSPVGIELRPGKLRVKEDSRANYADIVDVDHDAEVMVVGDVVRYFDRVRRNVNKAFMRQILRRALEEYKMSKMNENQADDQVSKAPQSATDEGDEAQLSATESMQQVETASIYSDRKYEREEKRRRRRSGSSSRSRRHRKDSEGGARLSRDEHREAHLETHLETHLEAPREDRREPEYDLRSMHNVAMAGLK